MFGLVVDGLVWCGERIFVGLGLDGGVGLELCGGVGPVGFVGLRPMWLVGL